MTAFPTASPTASSTDARSAPTSSASSAVARRASAALAGLAGSRSVTDCSARATSTRSRFTVCRCGRTRAVASAETDHHVLDLGVVLERVYRQVLAVAGLLVAAVRHLRGERDVVVDPDRAELQLARGVQRARDVEIGR